MKRTLISLTAAAFLLGGATSAMADIFAVSVDAPLAMSYNNNLQADSVLGYLIGLNTPFLVGFAVEAYDVSGTSHLPGGQKSGFTEKVTFTDIFLDLPFPAFNLGAGFGLGTGQFDLDRKGSAQFNDASLSQVFATLGYPVAPLLDVHVGYRVISGTADKSSGASSDADLSGRLLSLGVKFGF